MIDDKNRILTLILQQGLLPLYYSVDLDTSLHVLESLYNAGVTAVEYTNRGDSALTNFKEMIAFRDEKLPALALGIGTIKNLKQAIQFFELGADFIVSPGLVPEIANYCIQHGILYVPGCMTPTEIITAENYGLEFIKLFPGNVLKPDFVKSIKAIFPFLHFMPTGGVDTTLENLQTWFDAGVDAVGIGNKLITKEDLIDKNFSKIVMETARVLSIIQGIKKGRS